MAIEDLAGVKIKDSLFMDYSYLYQTLKAHYSSGEPTHSPDGGALGISFERFHSQSTKTDIELGAISTFDIEQSDSNPNNDFTYPVINPMGGAQAQGCIILLHGLNERSWDKYLPWAYSLALYTNKPVLLFPIAYHMNRSPKEWQDPRVMRQFVNERSSTVSGNRLLSVANVALSKRITEKPERFLLSGYQAANDLIDLVKHIHSGGHPLFLKGAKVDLFTYSIGTFLAQVMLLAHADEYFFDTRIFNFCGGSAFDDMYGTSKYIMDSVAFERLQSYYKEDIEKDAEQKKYLHKILYSTALGEAYMAMVSVKQLRKRGAHYFSALKDRITTVVLKQDMVMRPEKVKESLKGTRMEEWDFEFKYSHEMPFPILSNKLVNQVNEAFDRLMIKAALLFTH